MPRATSRRISVTKSEPAETTEVLAKHIVAISEGITAMLNGPLTEDAIIVLLHRKTKVGMTDIYNVLHGLRQLRGWYVKEPRDDG